MAEYVEQDGEIIPSYTGVNAPSYQRGSARDVEMPHDFPHDSTGTTSSPDSTIASTETGLIEASDDWPIAEEKVIGKASTLDARHILERISSNPTLIIAAADDKYKDRLNRV